MSTIVIITKQSGAALIISMVILLILTLLGVTALNTATTQELVVSNLQDNMINGDCSETSLKDVQQGLTDDLITQVGGAAVDTNFGALEQDLSYTTTCGTVFKATYEMAGKSVVDVQGCEDVNYEIELDIESPSGAEETKVFSVARRVLGSC